MRFLQFPAKQPAQTICLYTDKNACAIEHISPLRPGIEIDRLTIMCGTLKPRRPQLKQMINGEKPDIFGNNSVVLTVGKYHLTSYLVLLYRYRVVLDGHILQPV